MKASRRARRWMKRMNNGRQREDWEEGSWTLTRQHEKLINKGVKAIPHCLLEGDG